MIDIHSHVLPGVDDGSDSMETSLEMLAMAADSGVQFLVTTPHCNIPGSVNNYVSDDLQRRWDLLNETARDSAIPIGLCRGMEIFATPNLPELLRQGRVWTLNGTRYFLMEFDFEEDVDFCRDILKRCRAEGFHPIIAHPERYVFVQEDPSLAYEWCVAGYGLQLNKGSILGRFGRRVHQTAIQLLNHGLAACVASDAHSCYQRTTHMGQVKEYLTDHYGEEYAGLLLEKNPARILTGKTLLGYEPIPFE